jgi:succinyl-diaminopimelate desuccinylase
VTRESPSATDLLVELVKAPTVTPMAAPALDVLERHLAPAGFSIDRQIFSEPGSEPVENLFAAIGKGERHLTLAGHVDVVPPGPEASWQHPPFAAEIADDVLYGRGAADMKGGLAAMVAAALRFVEKHGADFGGRISFLVTGDEEAAAVNGTVKLLDWAASRGERFTAAIVGEPTSARELGDQIKIGRRGSFSATLVVEGTQGHAAYPELADNPVRGLTQLLHALQAKPLDSGSEHFGPSSLEVVSVDVGNPAWNVIPAKATARFNSRYNDRWSRETLQAEIEGRFTSAAADPALSTKHPICWRLTPEPPSADVFLTRDDALIGLVSGAVEKVVGRRPKLSTSGGTSDARFIKNYCPVVEFGPIGASVHQIDEHVLLSDIERTATIYEEILTRYFLGR